MSNDYPVNYDDYGNYYCTPAVTPTYTYTSTNTATPNSTYTPYVFQGHSIQQPIIDVEKFLFSLDMEKIQQVIDTLTPKKLDAFLEMLEDIKHLALQKVTKDL